MPVVVPKKKRLMLPLLTVVFILSYGLMTLLIVEQDNTIQSQSSLIRVLLPDSRELWALKGKAASEKAMQPAQSPKQSPDSKQSHVPSMQAPSTQAAPVQAPQHHAQASKTAKPQNSVPPVPASDLVDQRRALHSI